MEILVFSLIFLAFILACYEDIKKKEIYDYLNFSLVFFIMAIASVDSLINHSILPLKYAGFGLLIGFSLGSLLYYLGVWGGGDAKFLIGFSAASFYIIPYANSSLPIGLLEYLLRNVEIITSTILSIAQNYIIIVNVLTISFILYFITIKNESYIVKNALAQLVLLLLFTLGLLSTQLPINLLIIGLFSFIIIFFGHDYLFYSVFIRKKKLLSEIKQGDIPHVDIKNIKQDDMKYGISKEQLSKIKSFEDKTITIRKVFPLSALITLNFIVYILAILSIDTTNLEILFFLIKFLFISFMAGGVMAIFLMAIYLIKNFKQTMKLFSKIEKYFFFILIGTLTIGLVFNVLLAYISLLGLVYYFVRCAKVLEKLMFVIKKPLEQITLGDWIVQDIKVDKKTYFAKEDFKLGVNEHQLEKIKSLAKHHKKLREIYIKDGIAFLPPLFVGFIIALLL